MEIALSHLPDEIIVDEHITLRAFDPKYFAELKKVVAANKKYLSKWLTWPNEDLEISYRKYYEDAKFDKEDDHHAQWHIFIDNKLSGSAVVKKRYKTDNNIEIGYWLIESETGKGIATRCATTLLKLVFDETPAPFMEVGCNSANTSSAAVAKRLGFTFNREVVNTPILPAETDTDHYYRITREEFEAV